MAKITSKQYAEALISAISDRKISHEKAIRNFLELIRKNGDWSKRKEIIVAYESLSRKKDGRELVTIESARALTSSQRASIEKIFRSKIDLEERVNPELIAGVKLVIDHERQFDGTLKHKLDEILNV